MPLPDTKRAQELRKNSTKEERHLWYDFLIAYKPSFHRQKTMGPYIVDFYCDKVKLIVELDGGQHYRKSGMEYDKRRTEYLNRLGLRVVRYSNLDVMRNFKGICMDIDKTVKEGIPSSGASRHLPPGEGR